MKLLRLEEKALIDAIRKEFREPKAGLTLGIGDDAAVVEVAGNNIVITKDLLIEEVHFVLRYHPARLLGRKSLNVNLSDLAAMGAIPRYALLGLGLPRNTSAEWIREYFNGFKSAAREFGVSLIGGDITRARKVTISVTLLGEGRDVIRRDGARPGDHVFISGYLGDAREGLVLMKRGVTLGSDRKQNRMLRAFLDPKPLVELGTELARLKLASAMIDTSDGLSVDLGHLCQESGCGAEVYLEQLPVSPELETLQTRARDFALNGGEDYQLLFTVPENKKNLLKGLDNKYKLTPIGMMIEGEGIILVDRRNRRKKLKPKPWLHF